MFRGGLTADLQRLIPVDSANDLFQMTLPDRPQDEFYSIRPYQHKDEDAIYSICQQSVENTMNLSGCLA